MTFQEAKEAHSLNDLQIVQMLSWTLRVSASSRPVPQVPHLQRPGPNRASYTNSSLALTMSLK